MLFNSYIFIVVFLPLTLLAFWLIGATGARTAAKGWLVLASLFFYCWWNPPYVLLIVASILFNYAVGVGLGRLSQRPGTRRLRGALLLLGTAVNLCAIGYYKYGHFLAENANRLFGTQFGFAAVFLPLGISFFTFQQITYLVDASRGQVRNYNFIDYALFVTFFPQLIAGPIVHHADVLPQFASGRSYRFSAANLSIGCSIFAMGLFKKVVLADGVAHVASPVFAAAAAGQTLTFFEAWGGVLAYTCQLYFDFSGYSDMAIGLGRMFGIRLPLNFNSPYKAASIVEFWTRWHITLSQFLRDYLYIPLGGNRLGPHRRYVNLMITMLLGGLWHGAGWTFVVWGGLHGVYLVVNHGWRAFRAWRGWAPDDSIPARACSRLLTFLAVVVGWVFFRATSFEAALALLKAMAGGAGLSLPATLAAHLGGAAASFPAWVRFEGMFLHEVFRPAGLLWLAALLPVAWFAPNVVELMQRYRPLGGRRRSALRPIARPLAWRPVWPWALAVAACFVFALLKMSEISEFLYFQF